MNLNIEKGCWDWH